MIRAVYPTGANLKKIVQSAFVVLDEVPLSFKLDGLETIGLSPDKSTMIIVRIPSTSFEEYSITEETELLIEKDDLTKALRKATKRDRVIMEWSEGFRELHLTISNIKTGIERTYKVKLREVMPEKLSELSLDLEVTMQMPSEELSKIIKDLRTVGDEVTFSYSSKSGSIHIHSLSENKEYIVELQHFKPLISLQATAEAVSTKYSVDLLKPVAKALDLSDTVTVAFGTAKPMKIQLDLPGGGELIFWIAPRAA